MKTTKYFQPAQEKYDIGILTHSDTWILDHKLSHCQTRSSGYPQGNATQLVLPFDTAAIQTPQYHFQDHITNV